MSYQNFKQIIKEEYEKEFAQDVSTYEQSIFEVYEDLVKRICVRVWNEAIEMAADNAEADVTCLSEDAEKSYYRMVRNNELEVYVIKNSILKLKL